MTRYHINRPPAGVRFDRNGLEHYLRGYLQGDRARIATALMQIDRDGELDLGNVTITQEIVPCNPT